MNILESNKAFSYVELLVIRIFTQHSNQMLYNGCVTWFWLLKIYEKWYIFYDINFQFIF